MKFAITVHAAPGTSAARRALRFSQALLDSGHEIIRLFFYQDGVYNACNAIVVPQDEVDISRQWQDFIQANQLDAVVCIAAALRRGMLNQHEADRYERPNASVGAPWELSGLGQLHDAIQSADRLICFGGP
jgi:tRNA 2-thiouridine synthesizing protein D